MNVYTIEGAARLALCKMTSEKEDFLATRSLVAVSGE